MKLVVQKFFEAVVVFSPPSQLNHSFLSDQLRWSSEVGIRYKIDAQPLLTHFESICFVCILDLVSRGEWSVQILLNDLNNEKCCCCIHFLQRYSVICLWCPEIAKATALIAEVRWRSFNFPYQTCFPASTFPRISICFVFIYQRATVCISKRKGDKWGDLSEAMSCILLLAVFMSILFTRWWLRIVHCQDISWKVIKCGKKKSERKQ